LDLIEEHLESTYKTEIEVRPYGGRSAFKHVDFVPEVVAQRVDFSYPGKSKKVFENLNLKVQSGEFLGIVGPSGSGKTTLVDLLLGVVNPNQGSIQISGVSTSKAREVWPGAIAYVPQESSMINGTMKDNVCLGYDASEVPDSYVEELLNSVELGEFVNGLNGINTSVGERGSNLSGGQKQRVGLARALFTNPKLLVLDEATSALDATIEKKLTDFLNSIKGNLTLIVVAHRLSTVRNADRIVYIDKGEIRGEGKFEELRANLPEFDIQAKAMGL